MLWQLQLLFLRPSAAFFFESDTHRVAPADAEQTENMTCQQSLQSLAVLSGPMLQSKPWQRAERKPFESVEPEGVQC